MSVLELLATGAPTARFEELLDTARREEASDATLAELDQAARLASRVRALIGHAQQREAGLAALVDTAHDLTLVHGMDALLHEIARRARRLLNFDMAYIGLRDTDDESAGSLIRAAEGDTTSLSVGLKTSEDSGLGSLVQRTGAPAWSPDYLADKDLPHSPTSMPPCGPRVCTPSWRCRSATARRSSAPSTAPTGRYGISLRTKSASCARSASWRASPSNARGCWRTPAPK